MEWQVKDLPEDRRRLVEEKLKEIVETLEYGVLPYRRLDIRRLRGEWDGFLRLRTGNIRVILRLDFENKIVYVYNIHYRKSAYK